MIANIFFSHVLIDDFLSKEITENFEPNVIVDQALPTSKLKPHEFAIALTTLPDSNLTLSNNVARFTGRKAKKISVIVVNPIDKSTYKEKEKKYIEEKTPQILRFTSDSFGVGEKWYEQEGASDPSRFQGLVYEDIYRFTTTICRLGSAEAKKLFYAVEAVIRSKVTLLGRHLQDLASEVVKDDDEERLPTLEFDFGRKFQQYFERLREAIKHLSNALSHFEAAIIRREGSGISSITIKEYAKYVGSSIVRDALVKSFVKYEYAILVGSDFEDAPTIMSSVFLRLSLISTKLSHNVFYEILRTEFPTISNALNKLLKKRLEDAEGSSIPNSITTATVINEVSKKLLEHRPLVSGIPSLEGHTHVLLTKFVKICYEHLIKEIDRHLTEPGFESLCKITTLLISVGSYEEYFKLVSEAFGKRLNEILAKKKDSEKVITDLIVFRRSLSTYVEKIGRDSERGNPGVRPLVDSAWKDIIHQDENEEFIAKSLASHMEKILREKQSSKEIVDQMDEKLADSTHLFKFINNKELFEELYKRDLNRRLLQNRAYHMDKELDCIKAFKENTGDRLVRHMETMIEDINTSKTEIEEFYKSSESSFVKNMFSNDGFTVNVLSDFAWPSIPPENVKLPNDMLKAQEAFQNHYSSRHKKQILKWVPRRDSCTISATFNSGKKELLLDLFQTAVVVLFNDISDDEYLTFAEIEKKTEMVSASLENVLRSLIYGKAAILLRLGNGPDVRPIDKNVPFSANDRFSVNLNFSDKSKRIQLIGSVRFAAPSEPRKASNKVNDRSLELMVAINRVMKIERDMELKDLFYEVSKMTEKRGLIQISDMKKPLEMLLDQNALKRDENNNDLFHYVL